MTVDLESQLRSYAEKIVAESAPVAVAEVFERRSGDEPVRIFEPRKPPPRWVRPVMVAAAAFVAVIVAVGVAALLSLGTEVEPADPTTTVISSSTQPSDTTATPTTTALETPPTTVAEQAGSGLWTALSSAAPSQPDTEETRDTGVAGLPGWVNEVISDEEGLLTINAQTASTLSVRQSIDGIEWFNPITRPPQVFEPSTPSYEFVGGRWIAVGQYRGVEPLGVALSEDGAEWVDFRIPEPVPSGEGNPAYDFCGVTFLEPQAAVAEDRVVVLMSECRDLDLDGLGITQRQDYCSWETIGSNIHIGSCEQPQTFEVVDLDSVGLTATERASVEDWNRETTVVLVSESGSELEDSRVLLDGFVHDRFGIVGDRFVAGMWLGLTTHTLYHSTDGRMWTESPAPPGTVRMQLDSDRAFAIMHDGSASALWQWTPDGSWEQVAQFGDRLIWDVDSGASGMAVATQPAPDGSGLPEIDVGWSADGETWTWHTASGAFGGDPGDWANVRPTVGDGFVMALAWQSRQAVGLEPDEEPGAGQDGQLSVARWFRFDLH